MLKDIKNLNRPTIDEIYGFISHVGASARQDGREMKFTFCPFCNGGSHKDKNTFSINVDSGAYICHRASCGAKGSFVELAKYFNFPVTFEDNTYTSQRSRSQNYSPPQPQFTSQRKDSLVPENPNDRFSFVWDENIATPLSENIIQYFSSRGISFQTLVNYRIETGDAPEKIKWNFFEPSGERVELVKFRNINFNPKIHKAKEICREGGRQILFGMERCKPEYGPLVITEGQIDALSLSEVGIRNVVSVPIGKSGNKWIGNCYDFIAQFPEIIIFGDLEHDREGIARVTIVDHVENRVDIPIKVVRVGDYQGCKDANELLIKHGKDALLNAYLNARPLTISNSCDIADIEDVDLEALPHFETGIPELDMRIRGFYPGQLILLTGKTGEGKSTFTSQIVCDILEQGEKCLIYSGELDGIQVKNWLYMQLAGSSPSNFVCKKDKWGVDRYYVRFDIKQKINDWIREKLYIYKNNFVDTTISESDKILNCCLDYIRKIGVKFILIDNLMTAVSTTPGDNLYDIQTAFVRRLAAIAKRYGVVIMLIAHPRKTKESLELEDISGASNISNFADVILRFGRSDNENDSLSNCAVKILKSRLVTDLPKGEIKLRFFPESKRICGISDNNTPLPQKKYGWETFDFVNPNGFTIVSNLEDLPF